VSLSSCGFADPDYSHPTPSSIAAPEDLHIAQFVVPTSGKGPFVSAGGCRREAGHVTHIGSSAPTRGRARRAFAPGTLAAGALGKVIYQGLLGFSHLRGWSRMRVLASWGQNHCYFEDTARSRAIDFL